MPKMNPMQSLHRFTYFHCLSGKVTLINNYSSKKIHPSISSMPYLGIGIDCSCWNQCSLHDDTNKLAHEH
eukprot:1138816-Ditylum_brightwellii.AAC.2